MSFSIIIRDLIVGTHIGITETERAHAQRLQINAQIELDNGMRVKKDQISETVDYNKIVQNIQTLAADSKFNLLETFARHAADLCLDDPRTYRITIRVEKLDLYENAAGVGIELKIEK